MSFIFPRTVQIKRPAAQTGVGLQAYGGQKQIDEDIILENSPASIQLRRDTKRNEADLPATGKAGTWRVFMKLPNGSVRDRDIIVDDLGIRYQVLGAYWGSLGYNCSCERLEN